jgi:hypothetical protein
METEMQQFCTVAVSIETAEPQAREYCCGLRWVRVGFNAFYSYGDETERNFLIAETEIGIEVNITRVIKTKLGA